MIANKFPKGWIKIQLGEITSKPQYGWTSKSSEVGNIKYLRTTDLTKGNVNWATVPFCESEPDDIEKYKILDNDILISRAGSVGYSFRVNQVPENVIFASYLIRFKSIIVESKYIEYYLKSPSYWKDISGVSAGIAVQNINASKLSELNLPLPPLAEQKRIVAKLDAVFGHIETLKTRLSRIPELLKNFRQQVLTQAVTGKLENKRFELKPFGDFNVEIQTGPFGSALHKHDYIEGGTPVINPSHIKDGKIYPDISVTVDTIKANELGRWLLQEGDVIIGRRGEMGRAAKYNSKENMICGTGSLVIKKSSDINSDFLSLYLRSPFTINFLESNSVGSTMVNLNQKIVKSLPFPILTVQQQNIVVEHVESLFAAADAIEAQYHSLKQKIDALPQAVLAKAFRGELVPQNPKDEPASVLLERIKAEKAKAGKKGKGVTV
jgi:type I restriction enzyme S subunit